MWALEPVWGIWRRQKPLCPVAGPNTYVEVKIANIVLPCAPTSYSEGS